MAEHHLRRWFQFGILDLLILTTVVAVVVSLCQPVKVQANKAKPWIVGYWNSGDGFSLWLLPDGWSDYQQRVAGSDQWPSALQHELGRWTLAPLSAARDVFVLECGTRRLVIRSESGSVVIEELYEDGSVQSRLEQVLRLDGPMRDGTPHGTWTFSLPNIAVRAPGAALSMSLEYRHGEPTDFHDTDGKRDLYFLNEMRRAPGLPELTEHDFPDAGTTEEKRHE